MNKAYENIKNGETALGIEFGSTRIKAVLVDLNGKPIASGSYTWENRFENGFWTYALEDIKNGLKSCYKSLKADVKAQYGITLKAVGSMGISGMMHGYMAFDKDNNLLVPFRTWRNTNTENASEKLSELFSYNIPQRWSVAHLYEAVLNGEEHLNRLKYITTISVYIHFLLTGKLTAGVGEASGMFPIDIKTGKYDSSMMSKFDKLIADKHYDWNICSVLPEILFAGQNAGFLTDGGAKLLDPDGDLKSGIPFCPPEGDAGTGMTATNSIEKCTGNISAGTSVFAMIVLNKELSKAYRQIDLVATPDGSLTAMVHCNNCTGDIDAWVRVFYEFSEAAGIKIQKSELYDLLYQKALEGEKDCGGLLSYNYISGEPVSGLADGRPLFIRKEGDRFNLSNFMRMHLFSALAALKNGMDILFKQEGVTLSNISGHGGFFKTEGAGQKITAAALNTNVTVMKTAGEGGPWGMALLALYMNKKEEKESLSDFLNNKIFKYAESSTVSPTEDDVKGFESFMERYNKGLQTEKSAVNNIREY